MIEGMKDLIEAARASIGVHDFDKEHAVAVVPEGFTVKDLRPMLPPPPRPVELLELLTRESFCDYILRFGLPKDAVVFADETKAEYRAVLDYHRTTEPRGATVRGTCDHQVRYTCPLSPEWQTWTAASGKMVAQADFAKFLEDNLPDIVQPAAADMLKIALTLQVKKDANYASDLRLDNGQTQFRYEETIRGTTKAGDLTIPETFIISVPVFLGEARVTVTARLRYRIVEQKLAIGYELVRPQHVRLAAVGEVTRQVRERLPEVALYVGRR